MLVNLILSRQIVITDAQNFGESKNFEITRFGAKNAHFTTKNAVYSPNFRKYLDF